MLITIFKAFEEIQVVECADGVETLNFLYVHYFKENHSNISCIITDEFMNFMNGTDSVKVIKKWFMDKKIGEIPIIFTTAFLDHSNISYIEAQKPNKIINKPVEKTKLLDALKEVKVFNY
jgi:CheY-like chemotaxis protein